MQVPKTPPPRETYRFVLRTIREYDATIERMASTYEETAVSRDIVHPDGIRRPTIFLAHQTSRDRLVKDGWEDVTEQWLKAIEWAQAQPETVAPDPRPPKQRPTVTIRG